MNIQQLSNNIDQQLHQLDKKLAQLQSQLANPGADAEMVNKEIKALQNMRTRLLKSRNIMWQAHELQTGIDQKAVYRKRWLGICLCLVSLTGLALLGMFLLTH